MITKAEKINSHFIFTLARLGLVNGLITNGNYYKYKNKFGDNLNNEDVGKMLTRSHGAVLLRRLNKRI